MKKGMLYFLWVALSVGHVSAANLKEAYDKAMSTPECRQAPVNSGVIEYEVGMLYVDSGQIQIILEEPNQLKLKWKSSSQSIDFLDGEMIHQGVNEKTQKNTYTRKHCQGDDRASCYSLSQAYYNFLLSRPLEYLKENPNIDQANSVVCARNLLQAFSQFFAEGK